jgi:hypothetical protein
MEKRILSCGCTQRTGRGVRRAREREGALHSYHGSICRGARDLEPGAPRCQREVEGRRLRQFEGMLCSRCSRPLSWRLRVEVADQLAGGRKRDKSISRCR